MRLLWCITCLICIELWSSRLICFVLISSRATCSTLYRFCASAQNRIKAIFLCLKIGVGLFTCACAWLSAIRPSVHPWNHNVLCNPVRQVIYKIYKNWRMAISFSWAYYMVLNVKTCCETSVYVNNILLLITQRINTLKKTEIKLLKKVLEYYGEMWNKIQCNFETDSNEMTFISSDATCKMQNLLCIDKFISHGTTKTIFNKTLVSANDGLVYWRIYELYRLDEFRK